MFPQLLEFSTILDHHSVVCFHTFIAGLHVGGCSLRRNCSCLLHSAANVFLNNSYKMTDVPSPTFAAVKPRKIKVSRFSKTWALKTFSGNRELLHFFLFASERQISFFFLCQHPVSEASYSISNCRCRLRIENLYLISRLGYTAKMSALLNCSKTGANNFFIN